VRRAGDYNAFGPLPVGRGRRRRARHRHAAPYAPARRARGRRRKNLRQLAGLAQTGDFDNPVSESRKTVLEWDNRMEISLTKLLPINIILNMDNRDISSDDNGYEIDHRTSLALNWKVF
jgi:hypothetical protein